MVREFMSRNPLVIGPDIRVSEAVSLMKERNIWSPVVVKGGEILGFLTERDIIANILSEGIDPYQVKVIDVMTRRYGVLNPDETYVDASKVMMKMKSRLVVLDGKELIGVVTAADITRAYAESESTGPPLRKYATWEVLKVKSTVSVREAISVMAERRVGSLLIEESGLIKGIFTERDAVKRFLSGGCDLCDPVYKYAMEDLIVLDANSTLLDAAKLMSEHKIKRVPLVDEGEIKGIITARDIVEAIWRISTTEELAP